MNTKAENDHKESEQVNKERIKYNKKQQQQKCIMNGRNDWVYKEASFFGSTNQMWRHDDIYNP